MKKFIVIYRDSFSPAAIYEANEVNLNAYTCDKEIIHAELPVEGWLDQPFQINETADGATLEYT